MKPASHVGHDHECPSVKPLPHIGGPIQPPCSPTIEINGMPAARLGDRLRCSCAIDAITEGATTVLFNGKPAARKGDRCVEGHITEGEESVVIGGPTGKQALDDIISQYQVADDATTQWAPSGWTMDVAEFFGLAERPAPRTLTQTEANMLDGLGPFQKQSFAGIADEAFNTATVQYPSPPASTVPPGGVTNDPTWRNNDGQRDAFRHAFWNARLTQEFGEEWARQYTTAHEALPGNPQAREVMDLYNNEVGRMISAHNPGATPDELAALIKAAVDRGDMIVIDASGNLAWSNQVPLWQHGLAPNTPGVGGQPVPAGNASAQ